MTQADAVQILRAAADIFANKAPLELIDLLDFKEHTSRAQKLMSISQAIQLVDDYTIPNLERRDE